MRFSHFVFATVFASTAAFAALAHEQPIIDDELREKIEEATKGLDERIRHAIHEAREALNDELHATIDEALEDGSLEAKIEAALKEVEIIITEALEQLRDYRREHLDEEH